MNRKLDPDAPADRLLMQVRSWRVPRSRGRFGERHLRQLATQLGALSPAAQYAVAAVLMLVVGIIDVITGPELSFSIFYVVPIAIVAWYRSWTAGRIAVVVATIVWLVADITAGTHYTVWEIRYWNAGVRFGFFFLSGFLLSELRVAIMQAKAAARTDGLTEVANSRWFFEIASQEVARQQRYLHPLSIAFLDCDNFKEVNDDFGHTAGDALLCTIASCIKDSLRGVDTVARLGGDEFAILLPESNADAAATVVNKVRDVLAAAVVDYGVTFSIGIATYYEPPLNYEELVRVADEAMYEAKRQGKDSTRHRVYGTDLRGAV